MLDAHSLQHYSFFGGLTDEQMSIVIPHLKEDHFDTGTDIVAEGDDGDRMYFIEEGSVEVLKKHECPGGTTLKKLAELHKGDEFGEMELIDVEHRAATVRVIEQVYTLSLSNKDLYSIYHEDMKTYTILIMNLARDISRRLRKMDSLMAGKIYEEENRANP